MKPCRTLIAALFAMFSASALAQQVGTATAVNPLSESTQPGSSTAPLAVGARIIHKERIHTTSSGSVQLAFLDKSTLSIAPNTNIVINEFVYDPNSGKGHMLASLTKGALRFVGGALSHAGEASIVTPAAAVGIRGGTVTIVIGRNGVIHVIDQFGIVTVQNPAGTTVLSRPGFEVTVFSLHTAPGQPERVTQAEIDTLLALLTSKPGQNGGVPGLHTVTIGQCGIFGVQSHNCPNTPWLPTDTGFNNAGQLITQGTQFGTGTTPPSQPHYPYGR
ncbi:MAG TPA: FecR domain-containing protein [Xanthobacteraceae bacterium]|nr:FecR domain-containing protein [Xanthobacteraceae bacterium]